MYRVESVQSRECTEYRVESVYCTGREYILIHYTVDILPTTKGIFTITYLLIYSSITVIVYSITSFTNCFFTRLAKKINVVRQHELLLQKRAKKLLETRIKKHTIERKDDEVVVASIIGHKTVASSYNIYTISAIQS